MKAVVTGGRDYDDYAMIQEVLIRLNVTELYVGDASGADEAARDYFQNISSIRKRMHVFKADWETHGKAAGPIRNREMLKAAGPEAIVIAFEGGKGTQDCINAALERNMIILRVVP